MLTIYGVYRSRAIRPLWVLEECGAPFTHVPVIQAYRLTGTSTPGAPLNTAMPDYLAVNPLGQVPAMRDGALLLSESLAICLHIARKYGGTLGPASDDEASVMEQWALFAATAVEPAAIEILYTGRDGQADTPTGQGIIRLAAEKLKRPLARLESHLATSDWLMNRFTVADIMVAECLRYGQSYGPLLSDFPKTARWLSAAQSRPAFNTVWSKRAAEPE
ncbi:MAG: glutathione S-transferase family protein [Pseudotabrizicola sp.]|uniref:glutathione S-transferase family protein n=1 Tax=Pseudotabrizicola sp. TaxID=2939647 RepID=UPI0027165359|nr:glutathione S-transferase family protein [Pseudotabrizicola sp.]MDO8884213.1 glutathione S-transferase family protein [Pseudotabrizicola sp.]MDP2080544.1 glutathione S-transferase family protein [Pseudotabrizicola sp.]MDZ7573272.1 glutathione S-transferase family protein [Pseudotabrizicola sp.]